MPDHKTRLAAFALSRGYDEGTPVARQILLSGNVEDFGAMLANFRNSPEALRVFKETTGSELPAIDVETAPSEPSSEPSQTSE